jgi:hypothetical protein
MIKVNFHKIKIGKQKGYFIIDKEKNCTVIWFFSKFRRLYLNILVFQYLILIAEILFMRLNDGGRQRNAVFCSQLF